MTESKSSKEPKITQEEFIRLGEQYAKTQSKFQIFLYKWLGWWMGAGLVVYAFSYAYLVSQEVIIDRFVIFYFIPIPIFLWLAQHFHAEKWLSRVVYKLWLEGKIKLDKTKLDPASLEPPPVEEKSFLKRNSVYLIVLPLAYGAIILLDVFDIVRGRLAYIVVTLTIIYNIIKDEAKYKESIRKHS